MKHINTYLTIKEICDQSEKNELLCSEFYIDEVPTLALDQVITIDGALVDGFNLYSDVEV